MHKVIRRPASVRANYLINTEAELNLYINGTQYPVQNGDDEIAELFCNQQLIDFIDIQPQLKNSHSVQFLCELYNLGYLEFEL